ncbi:MAG: HD domain-containing protein [Bacteroidales bacterium]|nr:HD domain-containing protein [Bacteroidales bacterium]
MKPFGKVHIAHLTFRFNALAGSYLSDDTLCNSHIEIKRVHTLMVCEEIKSLAEETGLSTEKARLAYIIALFHDIGRFRQFQQYRTFDDSRSVNHAALSVDIIKSDGFLEHIPETFHELIFQTILNHNIPFVDGYENSETELFTKLLRDADKLDILRVITSDDLRHVLEWEEKTDSYRVPDTILQRFRDHQIVTLDLVRSVNDLRMVRISWIFDINFSLTIQKIKERKYLEKLFGLIPGSERLNQIKTIIEDYIMTKKNEGDEYIFSNK